MPTEDHASLVTDDSVPSKMEEPDIDGFTLNPYTSDILAMLEQQRRAQRELGEADDAGYHHLATAIKQAAVVAAAEEAAPSLRPAVTPSTGLFAEDAATGQRRLREAQLASIERKRDGSRRRCDLVDELFQKSVERRLHAMRRLAADPPADRLVGREVSQYVPVGLLPTQRRQVRAFMEKDGGVHAAPAPLAPVPAPAPTAADDTNALVFLTEMDGPGERARGENVDTPPSPRREVPAVGDDALAAAASLTSSAAARSGPPALLLDGEVPAEDPRQAEMRAHWQELGYNVVFVSTTKGGERQSVRRGQTRGSVQPSSGGGPGSGGSTLAVNADAIRGIGGVGKAMPAPSSTVLLQRRLPEEEEAFSAEAAHGSSGGRRRLGTGSSSRWTSIIHQSKKQ